MKKKYAALLVAAAIMAVPGTLAMAAGSPNTNATVSHGGGHSSSASSKSAGLNVNAGTITNKTTTGIKNNGQNGSNGITVSQGTSGSNNAVGFASDQQIKDGNCPAVAVFDLLIGCKSNNAVGFASDQQIKDGNSWAVAEKVFEINAGIPLYRVTGDPALVGYSPLMPAQQLQATDANGAVTKEAVIVNISVAALGNVQNIQLYFYNETTHAWELAAVNSVDYATNTINVTMPGNAIFTLVHKN